MYEKTKNKYKGGRKMEELKEKIREHLKIIEQMIENNDEKSKIEEKRKELDEILKEYVKHVK